MKSKPIHEIRLGNIKAAIWENHTEQGIRHSLTFTRLYKDGDQWKSTVSLGRSDLPKLTAVAQRCYEWLHSASQTAAA